MPDQLCTCNGLRNPHRPGIKWCLGPAPATRGQLAEAQRLADALGEAMWDHLNGATYERAFDLLCDRSKFVSYTEAADVIAALHRLDGV